MKRIFTTITFFIFITTNLFAVDFFVDQHHKNASDTTADSQGLSWSKPFKSPTYAYEQTVDNRGDTIHIVQGVYPFKLGTSTYNITLNKRNVAWIGYGEVIFEGLGKDVSLNNIMFTSITGTNLYDFNNFIFINFNEVMGYSGTSDHLSIKKIANCVFNNNNIAIHKYGGSAATALMTFDITNNIAYNNNIFFKLYTLTNNRNITGFINNTFFNNSIVFNRFGSGTSQTVYGIINNIFMNNTNNISGFTWGVSNTNNNFFNSPTTTGIFTTFNPLFNDTNPLNPNLTLQRTSPVRNISTTGSFLGAYGVADYSSSNDTNTWTGFYSWITDNDSVSIYSDTAFKIDTNGLTLNYGNEYPKNRRITRVFTDLGTIYGTPMKSFANANEVFNEGDYKDYWAVIDYDTSTSIREYRYIASNNPITEEDLKENSGKWTTIGFMQNLPTMTVRYFAVELYFRYNF